MSPELQVTLSGALSFGVPLGFAIRELFTINRGRGGPGPDRAPPPGPKPLPLGFVPYIPPRSRRPDPAPARQLERV